MLTKYTFLLLTLPALLILPPSIARANGIDVESGGVRVTISPSGGIRIQSGSTGTLTVPPRVSVPPTHSSSRIYSSPQTLSRPQTVQGARCYANNQQSTQMQQSGNGTSRSSSYTSTTTCH